jgi:putative membrane protein
MMSWTRTSISLIGFGFTMVQFFDRLATMQGVEPAKAPDAPRVLGLMLIGAGTLAVVISALQYRATVRYLWQPRFASIAGTGTKPSHTPMLTVAAVLVLIGLCAFGAVAFRVH